MRYRKLSPTGDYTFGAGNQNFYINNREAVAQAVKTRLLLLTGEWFLDVNEGTPYSTQILGRNTTSTRDLAVKARILETPGVRKLVSYASQLKDRAFSVQATIETIYGPTPVQVAFP